MSVIVYAGGHEIWEPSLRTARLFLAQVRALEVAMDCDSGISGLVSDEICIGPAILEKFVRRVLDHLSSSNNGALACLCGGLTAILLAMHFRATGEWITVPERLEYLARGARSVLTPNAHCEIVVGPGPDMFPGQAAKDWSVVDNSSTGSGKRTT